METPRYSAMCALRPVVAILAGAFVALVTAVSATVYVDVAATGAANGTSWVNAYTSIQAAIDDPRSATEPVWIAKGSYGETLVLQSVRQLYGGFPPGATSFAQRNPALNFTNLDLRVVPAPNHGITLVSVQNVIVDGIRVLSGNANGNDAASGSGGGLYCDAVDHTNEVRNCTFSENNAAQDGGAVVCLNGSSPSFSNCDFQFNTAMRKGGAVYAADGGPGFTDSIFTGNVSGGDGGGIHLDHTTGTLTRCDFVSNDGAFGGGVAVENGSAPVIERCNLFYNTAQYAGGVVVLDSRGAEFIRCRMEGNTAQTTGGGVAYFGAGSVKMDKCMISGNAAAGGVAGGLYFSTTSVGIPSFTNCVISGNTATQNGAIYAQYSHVDFQNCTISGNDANDNVGGVNSGPQTDLRFTNCIFSDNRRYAVAVTNTSGYPTLTACLFQGNEGGDVVDGPNGATYSGDEVDASFPSGKAQGNFIGDTGFVMDGPQGIRGDWTAAATYSAATDLTTFVDHTASFPPHDLSGRLINVTARTFEFRIVDNTSTAVLIQGDRARVGAGNPYRVIDYHLEDGSEAVDRGEAGNAPNVDLDGSPRPVDLFGVGFDGFGQGYDIGAYEFQIIGVTASPGFVDFGTAVHSGGPGFRTITLMNTGNVAVNYVAMMQDDPEGNFVLQPATPTGAVGVNQSKEFSVGFNPLSTGLKTATVTISTDGFPSIIQVYLAGIGAEPVQLWMLR